jgi:hypothetical protein
MNKNYMYLQGAIKGPLPKNEDYSHFILDLPSYQVWGKSEWKEGQILQKDIDFRFGMPCTYETVAIPLKREQDINPSKRPTAIPCIIQSAFELNAFELINGKRIIVYTGDAGIRSFLCDENWKPHPKPFAECPLSWAGCSQLEYHLKIREGHAKDKTGVLVEKYSTDLTSYIQKEEQPSLTPEPSSFTEEDTLELIRYCAKLNLTLERGYNIIWIHGIGHPEVITPEQILKDFLQQKEADNGSK